MRSNSSFAHDMLMACAASLMLVVAVATLTLPSVIFQANVPLVEAGTHLS